MTTLIQQKSPHDCALAAIAMAAGMQFWEDLWTDDDLKAVHGRGVADVDPWLERAGFVRLRDYLEVYTHGSQEMIHAMLWRRSALLSVNSLNNNGGGHMIYWDGSKIWDPHEGQDGYLSFRWLSSAIVKRAVIFNEVNH